MKRSRVRLWVATSICLLTAAGVEAQATRTWVSGVGDDANPCSRTAPCKTFAGAISKTAAGGEISVLNPGSYGALTITKAITINGDGTLAGVLNSLTTAFTVNAGVNDRVTIRSISIQGASNGVSGIRWLAGKSLLVDNVTITGFTSRGISVEKAAGGNLHVKNTTITQGSQITSATGIRLNSTAGTVLAMIDDCNLQELNNAVEVVGNSRATISNSVISGNTSNGVLANNGTAVVNVEGSVLAFNGTNAVNAAISGATIRISNNQIYNNTVGVAFAAGATVASDARNRIFANGASAAPNAVITIQ